MHFLDSGATRRDLEGLVGIEVKASATVNSGDFRSLRKLADACGDNFKTSSFRARLFVASREQDGRER
jgi:hypothetical protein